MNRYTFRRASHRAAHASRKFASVFYDVILPRLIGALVVVSVVLRVAACNLPPALVKSLTASGVTLACSIASASVPAADRSLTATICQDAEVIAPDVLSTIWEAAAAEQRASAAAGIVQPQADLPPRAVQCRGRNVMAVQANLQLRAQAEMDKVKECKP